MNAMPDMLPSAPHLPPPVSVLAPVAEADRLPGLDVARAIALLGIFFVNASIFGQPFATIMDPRLPAGESALGQGFYWFTMVFCAGKFFPLFSMLFGIGLAIILDSARTKGRGYVGVFLRRLFMLGIMGALHVFLLWPGDVLLIYATIGLWMLVLAPLSPRVLVYIGLSVLAVGLLIGGGLSGVSAAMQAGTEVVAKPMPEGTTPFEQWLAVLKDWNQTEQYDSRLGPLETTIMQNGPFLHAAALRGLNYAFSWSYVIFVMFWVILPCFCFGAALMKSGFVHGRLPDWRRRFILLGLGVGLPLNLFAAWAIQDAHVPWRAVAANVSMCLGGPMMSLMYLSLILNWVEAVPHKLVPRVLGRLGQMGLSGYILESVLMSAVMLHWGLGWFGQTSWADRGLLVLGLYALILAIANVWMWLFRFGPLEYLWRTWTYLRVPPLMRGSV